MNSQFLKYYNMSKPCKIQITFGGSLIQIIVWDPLGLRHITLYICSEYSELNVSVQKICLTLGICECDLI